MKNFTTVDSRPLILRIRAANSCLKEELLLVFSPDCSGYPTVPKFRDEEYERKAGQPFNRIENRQAPKKNPILSNGKFLCINVILTYSIDCSDLLHPGKLDLAELILPHNPLL